MKHWLVTVQITNRYWSIQVWQEAATPEEAVTTVQAKFDEATRLGYITGNFQVTKATLPEESD